MHSYSAYQILVCAYFSCAAEHTNPLKLLQSIEVSYLVGPAVTSCHVTQNVNVKYLFYFHKTTAEEEVVLLSVL